MDRPERYGHKRASVPYPGGVALFLAFLVNALIFLPVFSKSSPLMFALLGAATILAVTCFWDDRRGLSPYFRLFVQGLAALIMIVGGLGITSITNPFGAPIILDSLQIPLSFGSYTFVLSVFADFLTLVWVVAMINAFNWIDGVPGMVSGSTVVSSAILLLLSMRPGFHFVDQSLAITLSSILLGLSLAFFLFDFPPPRILMGDTGAMLLGLLVAVTAMISGGKIATTILVLGFPLLDFVWVILRRILKGQSPFKGDLWHFHHRFLKAGFSERAVVILFLCSGAFFGGTALLLHTEGKLFALGAVFLFMLLWVIFTHFRGAKASNS